MVIWREIEEVSPHLKTRTTGACVKSGQKVLYKMNKNFGMNARVFIGKPRNC